MKMLRLIIVLAIIFGGGLALGLEHLIAACLLFVSGIALYFVWNKRKMLPE